MDRPFVRIYESFTDTSAFEHINPNLIKRVFVDKEEDNEVIVIVEYINNTETEIPFLDHKEAQRFIKRIGGNA